jgi:hypothetical protein
VQFGQRVLAIDLDHQGNFTSPVMPSNRATTAGLTGDRTLTEAVSVMPSASFVMLTLERQPTMHASFVRNLRNFLRRSTRTSTCGFQHQHLDYYLDEFYCSLQPPSLTGSWPPVSPPRPTGCRRRAGALPSHYFQPVAVTWMMGIPT